MKYVIVSLALLLSSTHAATNVPDKDKRPSINVKASPSIAFSPARVVVTADVKGGEGDLEEFYCPAIEWRWGDGTRSVDAADCDPFEPGKTEIKRHFAADRVYQLSGSYRVEFRLKQKDRIVASGSTLVNIRPGVREGGGS